jgi:hypothetical protein
MWNYTKQCHSENRRGAGAESPPPERSSSGTVMPLAGSHGVTLRASARKDVPFGRKVGYVTRKFKLGPSDPFYRLARGAGDLWSLTYKAQLRGMTIERVPKALTSQTCQAANTNTNRVAETSTAQGVRLRGPDAVSARNILNEKYPEDEPIGFAQVAGEMASPTEVRSCLHVRCNPASSRRTSSERQECRSVGQGHGSP